MRFAALATDYDETLADHGRVLQSTEQALLRYPGWEAEYRLRILQPANSRTVNDLRITSMGLGDCLDALQRATRYSERRGQLGRGKGIGLAGSAYISGAGLPIYWNEVPHSGVSPTEPR